MEKSAPYRKNEETGPMAILKADILTFVNEALEEDLSGTELDLAIELTLTDMSDYNLLVAQAGPESIAIGDQSITTPTGFREALVVQLTHTDTSKLKEPLNKLPGGLKEYRELMAESSSNAEPRWWTESDGTFFLYPPANAAYTGLIDFYKDHPEDADNIEYGDEFSNCVRYGTAFHYAMLKTRERYMNIWGPKYDAEKSLRRAVIDNKYPCITRDF